jgi:hypothetical protein
MSTTSYESEEPIQTQIAGPRGFPFLLANDTIGGALRGLVPLGLLIVVIVIVLVLTALMHQLVASSGFFAQQQAAVITLFVGLVLALAVYGIAIFFTLQRVAMWQQNGSVAQARAALWSLGVTAFIVVLPVLLAIVLPQHPAP